MLAQYTASVTVYCDLHYLVNSLSYVDMLAQYTTSVTGGSNNESIQIVDILVTTSVTGLVVYCANIST